MDTGTIDGIEVSVTASRIDNSIQGTFVIEGEKQGLELADLYHKKSEFMYVGPATIDRKRYHVVLPILITNLTERESSRGVRCSGTFISASAPTEQTLIEYQE